MYKKVFHICSSNSNFYKIVLSKSKKSNQEVISFNDSNLDKFLISIRIIFKNLQNKNSLFVFHRVDNLKITFIKLFSIKKIEYCLIYWGHDFYFSFIDERILDEHCLKKLSIYDQISRYINMPVTKNNKVIFSLKKLGKFFYTYLALKIVKNSVAIIGMPPKQKKILNKKYYKFFKKELQTKNLFLRPYIESSKNSTKNYFTNKTNEINFLISHSASPNVHHEAAIETIKIYSKKWRCKVNIYGFISYSGGDIYYRKNLLNKLNKASSFAQSKFFELNFLEKKLLIEKLKNFDLAINLSSRDEGCTLLGEFAQMGGILCFNKFSMNYDVLKLSFKENILDIQEFLNTSPKQLKIKRKAIKSLSSYDTGYQELFNLK